MQPRDLTKYPMQLGEEVKLSDGTIVKTIGVSKSGKIVYFIERGEEWSETNFTPVHRLPPMPEKWVVLITKDNHEVLWNWVKVFLSNEDLKPYLKPGKYLTDDGNVLGITSRSIISFEMWHYWMVEQKGTREQVKAESDFDIIAFLEEQAFEQDDGLRGGVFINWDKVKPILKEKLSTK